MTRKPLIDLIVAVVVLAAALGTYSMWYARVSSNSVEAAAQATELQSLGELGGRAATVRRSLDELTHHETQVYSHLVGSTTVVSFLEEVEATGDSFGADVNVDTVGNATGKPGQLQMTLRITGSFDAIMRTLGALEYAAYDTTLTTLALSSAITETSTVWTANATFLVGMPPAFPNASTTPKTP